MKRVLALVMLVLFIGCLHSSAFADDLPQNINGGVFVKTVTDSPIAYEAKINTIGYASVTLPNGISVSVTSKELAGLTFMVMPITSQDTEAWMWFSDCLDQYGDLYCPMEVFFLDNNGNRCFNLEQFTLTIKMPEGISNPTIIFLTTGGEAAEVASKVVNGSILISANRSGYYALIDRCTDGDANNDKTLNEYDAVLILQYSVGLISENEINLVAGDMNKDNNVDPLDAALVLHTVTPHDSD